MCVCGTDLLNMIMDSFCYVYCCLETEPPDLFASILLWTSNFKRTSIDFFTLVSSNDEFLNDPNFCSVYYISFILFDLR